MGDRLYTVKSGVFRGRTIDGPVHYVRLLWEENQYTLEHLTQDDIDAIDAIILRVKGELSGAAP